MVYCNICKKTITKVVYDYSMKHYGKALCMQHQPQKATPYISTKKYNTNTHRTTKNSKITPQAIALYNALKKRRVRCKLEADDGYKHVDIRIEDAKLDIEIDGKQHILNYKQMNSDIKRSEGSREDDIHTLRYSNSEIDEYVEQIADNIAKLARRRKREEDEF